MKHKVTHWVDIPQLPHAYREPVLLEEDVATIKKELQLYDFDVGIRTYRQTDLPRLYINGPTTAPPQVYNQAAEAAMHFIRENWDNPPGVKAKRRRMQKKLEIRLV